MSDPLEVLGGERLRKRELQLAVAESCTGGLIGHRLTNVPGSSDYFLGGVITYANEAKVNLLGVSPATLAIHGAVSKECALEMAQGVRSALQADIGLSVTGIAGPSGGTSEKPVGTVWIGLSSPQGEHARHFLWTGDRLAVKEQSAQAALDILWRYLQKGTHARKKGELDSQR